MTKAYLIFEDGTVFEGDSIGAGGKTTGIVKPFNGMTGYQQFLSNPNCFADIICMTYPIIGTVGASELTNNSSKIQAAGVIVREINMDPSSSSSDKSFDAWLKEYGCIGICNVDTRSIIKHLQISGPQNAVITSEKDPDIKNSVQLAKIYMTENILDKVSTKEITEYKPKDKVKGVVCAIDLGISLNEIRALNNRGIKVIVFPYKSDFSEIMKFKPDGIYISDGPQVSRFELLNVYETLKSIKSKVPILACGNGHVALAQSYGLIAEDLGLGHHGVNYPVKNLETNRTYITTQNHRLGFKNEDLFPEYNIEVTYRNINDDTIEGFKFTEKIMSVQFIPDIESQDFNTGFIWDDFVKFN